MTSSPQEEATDQTATGVPVETGERTEPAAASIAEDSLSSKEYADGQVPDGESVAQPMGVDTNPGDEDTDGDDAA